MLIRDVKEALLTVRTDAQHRIIAPPITPGLVHRMHGVTLCADEALFLIEDDGCPMDAALSGIERASALAVLDTAEQVEADLLFAFRDGLIGADQARVATNMVLGINDELGLSLREHAVQ